MSRPAVIAIDGPAASGKGTIARQLAAHFGFAHLDTGSLYRAVALHLLNQYLDPDNAVAAVQAAETMDLALLDDPGIRTRETGVAASKVAANPGVRRALLGLQCRFCANPPGERDGAVLDGRDIGTVIAPDATVKLFVTASAETRARRRQAEVEAGGTVVDLKTMLADLAERDARDSSRAAAPLKPVEDAHLLDTTEMSIETAIAEAIGVVERGLSQI